jgi:arylsulfatase A-like enzyme
MHSLLLRVYPPFCLAACIFALAPTGCRRPDPASPPQPVVLHDIVIYLVDTLRADHLGVYGYPRDTSPRLDAFARDAVVFRHAYAPSAWTKPSTASLLTGLHPRKHAAIRRDDKLAGRVVLLSEHLDTLGYHNAAFVTNPNAVAIWGFDQGFDAFHDIHDRHDVERQPRAEEVANQVFAYRDAHPDRPFFYYIHTLDPHDPYAAPPPFAGRWSASRRGNAETPRARGWPSVADQRAAYDEEIAYGDEHFGRVLERLKADGLYEGALIVFTSDHGEEFRDHGQLLHGHTLYNELVRVPLIVKLPGNAHAGRVVEAEASLLDVVPTILSLLAQTPPDGLDGVDLMPSIESPEHADARPLFLDLDLERVDRTFQGDMYTGRGILAEGYKYLQMTSPKPTRELYDLRSDPHEQSDLFDAEPQRAGDLAATLAAFEAAVTRGVHLRCLNASDDSPRTLRGRFAVQGGRFSDPRWWQFEDGDAGRVSDDGTVLSFEVTLRNHPHPVGEEKLFVVDEDHVSFSVDPLDAEIAILSLVTQEGAAAPIYAGLRREPLGSPPLSFRMDAQELWAPSFAGLFRADGRRLVSVPGGCYLLIVPAPERTPAAMTDELRARLRALGYAK